MQNTTQNAAYAVAKPQSPIMVSGWTQDPVFLGEQYFHPVKKTLEEFYREISECIDFDCNGLVFKPPFESFECFVVNGKRIDFHEVHAYLHYCYDHGKMAEQDLLDSLMYAISHYNSIHDWKEEYNEVG